MRECLDEGMLQSYFDGELSTRVMESATLHLASCVTCSAAARELEQETSLLTTALAAEFEGTVPTENLRRRVNAAVAGLHVVSPVTQNSSTFGFLNSLSSLFTLVPQRALGFASLAIVLVFGGIFAIVKFRQVDTTVNNPEVIAGVMLLEHKLQATPVKDATPAEERASYNPPATNYRLVKHYSNNASTRQSPVKLLPGERSYLKAIARLDTTIKSDKKAMRPALQVEYERNLAVVDRAIAATRSAAKSNPNDPDAADFMFAAYQSKVDLLNTIADARVGGRSH